MLYSSKVQQRRHISGRTPVRIRSRRGVSRWPALLLCATEQPCGQPKRHDLMERGVKRSTSRLLQRHETAGRFERVLAACSKGHSGRVGCAVGQRRLRMVSSPGTRNIPGMAATARHPPRRGMSCADGARAPASRPDGPMRRAGAAPQRKSARSGAPKRGTDIPGGASVRAGHPGARRGRSREDCGGAKNAPLRIGGQP
jgi:hypothetical protein